MKKRICVVGGGNLGHYIVAKLGREHSVYVYTRNSCDWGEEIVAEDISGEQFAGKLQKASDKAEDVVKNAEVIFVTWPTNILNERIDEILPYIDENAWVCLCPGYGGKEFICLPLIEKGVHVFGTQRVFSSTKVIKYGQKVACIDNRPAIQVGAVKKNDLEFCNALLEELFRKKCVPYSNYLNITLTPSNPVLHTSRLYSLFKNYEEGMFYESHFKFYSEWDNASSEVLLRYDEEVQNICRRLTNMDLSGVKSLREHYEIAGIQDCNSDSERMTKKIQSLKFLKDNAPMTLCEKGYIPDLESRYFQEDFVFGLCVIRSFAKILCLETKQMDEILLWFQKLMGKDILEKGMNVLPVTHGISNEADLYDFYMM